MPRQRTSGLDFEALHRLHMQNYERLITKAYDRAIYEAVAIAVTLPKGKPSEELFSFDKHPASKKRVEAMMSGLQGRMQGIIEQGMRAEWTLANNKTDALVKRVFGKKLNDEAKHRLLSNNEDAREAFIQRKEKGLGLSDRVWRYTEQFKSEIEMGLDIGIRGGKSADELSRSLRGFLREPNKLFRRVRDEHGQLKLSARAKAYHPGQGVYRSSYKNALRLAVTETNIAYRTADHERQKALDFVVGIEVHLSGNHTLNGKPFKCMCDDLVGKYPKDFKFTGWHPHCRCYTTPILKTPEEMARDTQKLLRGEPVDGHSVNEVKDLPQGFKTWMAENKSRIEGAKTLPYFIKDNFVDGILPKGMRFKPAQELIAPEKVEVHKQDNSFDYSKRNEALDAYISGDIMWLNNYLRGRGDFGELSREEQRMLDELTSVTKIAKVGERTLWRSVDARAIFGDMTDLEFDDLVGRLLYGDNTKFVVERTQRFMDVVGKEITEKGFMSTTKSKEVATEWGDYSGSRTPVLMKIRTTANTRGVDVEKYTLAHNAEVEQSQAQREILLRRGQRYKVVNIKELDGHICVEVELIDEEVGTKSAVRDQFKEAIDSMQADISSARRLAVEWGIKDTDIDTAIQRSDIASVKTAIMKIKSDASRLSREYATYMSDASKTINEAKLVRVDAKVVQSDVNALVNKSIWNAGKSGYNQRLQSLKDAIEQSLVIVRSVRSEEQQKNEAKVAAILGVKQGKDMTFDEANDLRGNPKFEHKFIPDPNGRYVNKNGERFSENERYKRKYAVNCQSCVVANEMRRRGMDVEALGNTEKEGNTPHTLSTNTELAWTDENGKTPKSDSTYGSDYHTMMNSLNSLTEAVGRYHIKWQWKNGGGHIITCERLSDKTLRIYDPQTGKVITNFEEYTKSINLSGGIQVLRVDTLQVNTDIIAGVVAKRKAKKVKK